MISYLQGSIILRGKDFVILEVQGVGYKVFLSDKTLLKLPKTDHLLKVYTYLHLREGSAELYGFMAFSELELFETLNNISGIGPRTALILAAFGSLENLKGVIDSQGDKFFREVKGIGQKKMQKIILEITGKIKELSRDAASVKVTAEDETVGGLVSLGFSKQQAKSALSCVPEEITNTEQKIKEALKFLNK